jgi:superoxide dismutase
VRRLSRRELLAAAAVASAGAALGIRAAGAVPKETGLASEGLLAGQAGFQPRTAMALPYAELAEFLSATQLAAHHAEYVRLVAALKTAEDALSSLPEDVEPARYASLRRAHVSTANAVLLHEFYFRNLAPRTVAPPRYIENHVREHMGSIERWRADFTRCALAAERWAVLVYDPYDDRWHDAMMNGDDDGVWLGANPLVVCDVSEHAYAHDYSRRDEYVTEFFQHLDWEEVARRYKRVDRM